MSMCPVVLRLSRIVFRHFKSIVMCHQRPDVFLGPLPIINKLLVWVYIFVCVHIRKFVSNSVRKWVYGCVNLVQTVIVFTHFRAWAHFRVRGNVCNAHVGATENPFTLTVCLYVILPLIF